MQLQTQLHFTVDFLDLAGNPGAQVTALAMDADGGVSFDKQAPSFYKPSQLLQIIQFLMPQRMIMVQEQK